MNESLCSCADLVELLQSRSAESMRQLIVDDLSECAAFVGDATTASVCATEKAEAVIELGEFTHRKWETDEG